MIMRRPRSCCLGPLAWRVLAAGVARSRPGREAAAREVAAREAAAREVAAARAEARRGSSCGVRPVAPLSPGGSVGRERQPEVHRRAMGAAACEGGGARRDEQLRDSLRDGRRDELWRRTSPLPGALAAWTMDVG